MKAKLLLMAFGVAIVSAGAIAWSKFDTSESTREAETAEPRVAVAVEPRATVEAESERSTTDTETSTVDPPSSSPRPDQEILLRRNKVGEIVQQLVEAPADFVFGTSALADEATIVAGQNSVVGDSQGIDEKILVAGIEVHETEGSDELVEEIEEIKQEPSPRPEAPIESAEQQGDIDALRLEVERLRVELAAERAKSLATGGTMSAEEAVSSAKPGDGEYPAVTPVVRTVDPDDPLAALGDVALPLTLTEVHFDTGKANMTPGGQRKTQDVIALLKRLDNPVIRIEGFTDTTGSAERNKQLALNRAESVRAAIVALGYDPAHVELEALGETNLPEPTGDNVSEPLNRCVGIVLVDFDQN